MCVDGSQALLENEKKQRRGAGAGANSLVSNPNQSQSTRDANEDEFGSRDAAEDSAQGLADMSGSMSLDDNVALESDSSDAGSDTEIVMEVADEPAADMVAGAANATQVQVVVADAEGVAADTKKTAAASAAALAKGDDKGAELAVQEPPPVLSPEPALGVNKKNKKSAGVEQIVAAADPFADLPLMVARVQLPLREGADVHSSAIRDANGNDVKHSAGMSRALTHASRALRINSDVPNRGNVCRHLWQAP